jgi:hypothetical protein
MDGIQPNLASAPFQLHAVGRSELFTGVVEQILEGIRSGVYSRGDALPYAAGARSPAFVQAGNGPTCRAWYRPGSVPAFCLPYS